MKWREFTRGWRLGLYLAPTLILAGGSAAAIAVNPWFSFARNAMSDLGNPANGPLYWLYNYVLIASGALYAVYFAAVFRRVRPRTSLLLFAASLFLVLVGVFHEGYGRLHYYVSVLYFVNGMAGLAAYWGERGSLYGISGFYASLAVFALQYTGLVEMGVCIPEIVSSTLFYLIPALEVLRASRRR